MTTTPNNQDRLLSDEELRNVLTDFTKRVRVETPDGYDYKTYVDFDEVLSVFNTQKRLYAESVIGGKEPHIIVDNGVAIDSCDSYKTQNESDCNCPAGERNQLRTEQRARIK